MAEAGQENIETVHEPKPIQAADTLWGQGRRAMKDLHGPQTQVREGAYAIKVSMSCSNERFSLIYWPESRTDHLTCRAPLAPMLLVLPLVTSFWATTNYCIQLISSLEGHCFLLRISSTTRPRLCSAWPPEIFHNELWT